MTLYVSIFGVSKYVVIEAKKKMWLILYMVFSGGSFVAITAHSTSNNDQQKPAALMEDNAIAFVSR